MTDENLFYSKINFVQDYVMTQVKANSNVSLNDLVKQALEAWALIVA